MCGQQESPDEKRFGIKSGDQEMAIMVDQWQKNF